jgi:HEAT repeat protein
LTEPSRADKIPNYLQTIPPDSIEKGYRNMSMNDLERISIGASAADLTAQTASTAQVQVLDELIAGIKSDSAEKRTESWQSAGKVGAPAVKPLAKVMTDDELEVARAAKRALWQIVRYAARPGANREGPRFAERRQNGNPERRAVETELTGLLSDDQPVAVRREVLWMLSEIGTRRDIKPIAWLMGNKELREDARMALERIPTMWAVAALKAAFEAAPEDFKYNIAQSLRKRGEQVDGYPCQKLVPTKETDVKPL